MTVFIKVFLSDEIIFVHDFRVKNPKVFKISAWSKYPEGVDSC